MIAQLIAKPTRPSLLHFELIMVVGIGPTLISGFKYLVQAHMCRLYLKTIILMFALISDN